MKPIVKWIVLLFAVIAISSFVVRRNTQNNLNRQLLEAVRNGESVVDVHILLSQGADPNTSGVNELDNALFLAIESGSAANVHALLEAGASTRPVVGHAFPVDFHVGPASVEAAGNRNRRQSDAECRAIFSDLRRHGASLEEQDSSGFTPLRRAVWAGNLPAIKVLLKMGTNRDALDNNWDKVEGWIGLNASGYSPDIKTEIAKLIGHYHKAHSSGSAAVR